MQLGISVNVGTESVPIPKLNLPLNELAVCSQCL
jgi:hypothetical protein